MQFKKTHKNMTKAFLLMVKVLVAHTMKGNVSLKEKKDSSAICRAYSVLQRTLPTFPCGMLWPRKDEQVVRAAD